MALGSTQPLREMSTRNLPEGKGRPAREADNLTAICDPIVSKMWERRHLTNLWASTPCYRDSFTFTFGVNKNRRYQEEKMTYERKGTHFQRLSDTLMFLSHHEHKIVLITLLFVASLECRPRRMRSMMG
jgi:hypothetical protein